MNLFPLHFWWFVYQYLNLSLLFLTDSYRFWMSSSSSASISVKITNLRRAMVLLAFIWYLEQRNPFKFAEYHVCSPSEGTQNLTRIRRSLYGLQCYNSPSCILPLRRLKLSFVFESRFSEYRLYPMGLRFRKEIQVFSRKTKTVC